MFPLAQDNMKANNILHLRDQHQNQGAVKGHDMSPTTQ